MGLFNKFWRKDEELTFEEQDKLNSILARENGDMDYSEDDNKKNQTQDTVNFTQLVAKLNLEDLHRLKELLDIREEELLQKYGLKETKIERKRSYNGEINIKEHITEKDLDTKTYTEQKDSMPKPLSKPSSINEINHINDKNDVPNYVEINDSVAKLPNQYEKKQNENIIDKNTILSQIKDIFGGENVISKTLENFHPKLPKDKNILCIGIRNQNAFRNDMTTDEQNTWFISKIKTFDKLKLFKMLESTKLQKDLFFDNGKIAILICYKSTQILKSSKEFNFSA